MEAPPENSASHIKRGKVDRGEGSGTAVGSSEAVRQQSYGVAVPVTTPIDAPNLQQQSEQSTETVRVHSDLQRVGDPPVTVILSSIRIAVMDINFPEVLLANEQMGLTKAKILEAIWASNQAVPPTFNDYSSNLSTERLLKCLEAQNPSINIPRWSKRGGGNRGPRIQQGQESGEPHRGEETTASRTSGFRGGVGDSRNRPTSVQNRQSTVQGPPNPNPPPVTAGPILGPVQMVDEKGLLCTKGALLTPVQLVTYPRTPIFEEEEAAPTRDSQRIVLGLMGLGENPKIHNDDLKSHPNESASG
ncbi:hypothetical protein DMENIID0001_065380 [Sergentomyia squamirostris]